MKNNFLKTAVKSWNHTRASTRSQVTRVFKRNTNALATTAAAALKVCDSKKTFMLLCLQQVLRAWYRNGVKIIEDLNKLLQVGRARELSRWKSHHRATHRLSAATTSFMCELRALVISLWINFVKLFSRILSYKCERIGISGGSSAFMVWPHCLPV